uniref:Uncharacterized protein n=1 Tax=Schizaphis graminum TaxID=13262 RepID=A0A2S2P0Y7_SCHGA
MGSTSVRTIDKQPYCVHILYIILCEWCSQPLPLLRIIYHVGYISLLGVLNTRPKIIWGVLKLYKNYFIRVVYWVITIIINHSNIRLIITNKQHCLYTCNILPCSAVAYLLIILSVFNN